MAGRLLRDDVGDAIGVVLAKMRSDEEGAQLLLHALERSELECLAGSLAAILGALGPRAFHGEGEFIALLHALRAEV